MIKTSQTKCPQIKACLKSAGFPVASRDFAYIRTAESVGRSKGLSKIVTDDMHFFNPKKVKCSVKERARILRECKCVFHKFLKKNASFHIASVYSIVREIEKVF